MTLPYQWNPLANHSISIEWQSSAQQCWTLWACISDSIPASCPTHDNPIVWDLANLVFFPMKLGHFWIQLLVHFEKCTVIIFECNKIVQRNLQDIWPEFSSVNTAKLVKKIYYISGDIEFFLGGGIIFFSGAPCTLLVGEMTEWIYSQASLTWRAFSAARNCSFSSSSTVIRAWFHDDVPNKQSTQQ